MSNKLYQDIPNGSLRTILGPIRNVMCSVLLREANITKFDINDLLI